MSSFRTPARRVRAVVMSDHDATSPAETGEPLDGQVRGVPSDNTTLTGILATSAQQGFEGQFIPLEGAAVECGSCGARIPAADLEIFATRRLEGASDPDDMIAVYAVRCSRCGRGGTLVLGFGPTASETDADISVEIGRQHARDHDVST